MVGMVVVFGGCWCVGWCVLGGCVGVCWGVFCCGGFGGCGSGDDADDHDDAAASASLKGVKLKMFNKSKERFYVCCIESIDDYNIIVEPLDAVTTARLLSTNYFVYGQEIDDYHYMNNDSVFSTLVSAFHALDSQFKQQTIMLEKQKIIIDKIISKTNLNL